jgi:hypothetical protein
MTSHASNIIDKDHQLPGDDLDEKEFSPGFKEDWLIFGEDNSPAI